MTPDERTRLRQKARRWARKGAREFPGVRFVAHYDGTQISFEQGKDGKIRRVP